MDYLKQNLDHYSEHAAKLAANYRNVPIEQALPAFTARPDVLDGAGKAILDLGCGGGSDADWLAQHGWQVTAVDGSAGMLAEAHKIFSHPHISWLQDSAPDLGALRALGLTFDAVLMNAFIFHFNEADRRTLLDNIRAMLKPKAVIHMTLRRGPTPEGRVMHHVSVDEMQAWAAANGMSCHQHAGRHGDSLGRSDVSWEHITIE